MPELEMVSRELRFGIEIESIIHIPRLSTEAETTFAAAVKLFVDRLVEDGLDLSKNHSIREYRNYSRWTMMSDGSIKYDQKKEEYGVEIVSPIPTFVDRAQWHSQLDIVFSALQADPFHAISSETCGTHVHISLETGWSLTDLRNISQGSMFFAAELDKLAEKVGRKDNQFAIVNKNSPLHHGKTTTEILARIANATTTEELIDAICPVSNEQDPRYYQWSLWSITGLDGDLFGEPCDDPEIPFHPDTNTSVGKLGTIEFRLPPDVLTTEAATTWIDFANLFILACVRTTAA
ncbi:putative amidoligase [Xylariaceae sp. FL0016]|nr:putative amidoligase [Xylariaceae sp. FL0016]